MVLRFDFALTFFRVVCLLTACLQGTLPLPHTFPGTIFRPNYGVLFTRLEQPMVEGHVDYPFSFNIDLSLDPNITMPDPVSHLIKDSKNPFQHDMAWRIDQLTTDVYLKASKNLRLIQNFITPPARTYNVEAPPCSPSAT